MSKSFFISFNVITWLTSTPIIWIFHLDKFRYFFLSKIIKHEYNNIIYFFYTRRHFAVVVLCLIIRTLRCTNTFVRRSNNRSNIHTHTQFVVIAFVCHLSYGRLNVVYDIIIIITIGSVGEITSGRGRDDVHGAEEPTAGPWKCEFRFFNAIAIR